LALPDLYHLDKERQCSLPPCPLIFSEILFNDLPQVFQKNLLKIKNRQNHSEGATNVQQIAIEGYIALLI
jgi:hypothetical protein